MELRDKVAVITGSGGGIGEAIARRFAAEGARVVVTDRDEAAVRRVAASIGTVGLAVDITSAENVKAVAELARRTYGEIDIWFSNAGHSGPREPGIVQHDAAWDVAWNLHVMAHVHAVREVLPAMLAKGDGYLLQTASVVALSAQADKVSYMVTKHAALAFAEWLAITYRPRGIKVTCFCPGAMLTPMLMSNEFPPDHPIFSMAVTPEQVAGLMVHAVEEEKFLVVTSDDATDALVAKAADYDAWLESMSTHQS